MADFRELYLGDPEWRDHVYQYVPGEFHHLFDDYPCSLVRAARAYRLGERPFDRWYEYTKLKVWYEDNHKDVHLWFKDGKLFQDKLEKKPEIPDCLNINIDGFWAYIQIGSYIVLDILDGIPLPDMLTGKISA